MRSSNILETEHTQWGMWGFHKLEAHIEFSKMAGRKTLPSTKPKKQYIASNEWTSRDNCLELDLQIDTSESSKKT